MSLHFSTLCFMLIFALYDITLGLTHACNHANRVSRVNEYTFTWVPLEV